MAEQALTEQLVEVGPPRMTFSTFLLKVLSGGIGGSLGALILLVIFMLGATVLQPMQGGDELKYVSPIFVFVLMIMVFLASTASNLLSIFLLSLTEKDKYIRTRSAIYQVFILSVVIFILMVPIYLLAASLDVRIAAYAVALHIILTAQLSASILEIVSDYKYSLVGIYGVTFSIVISALIMVGIYGLVNYSVLIFFLALPIVWVSIAIFQSIFTMIYGWIARLYDKDFLSTKMVYGDDYGKEVEEKPEAPHAVDEAGADFLKHN
jgi:hypothetical protein